MRDESESESVGRPGTIASAHAANLAQRPVTLNFIAIALFNELADCAHQLS